MSKTTALFQLIRQQADKMSVFGSKSVQKWARPPVEKVNGAASSVQVIEGQAYQRELFDPQYSDIQQLFRHQFPSMTQQLLGRRYHTVNKISRFILPNGMDQAADEVLQLLEQFADHLAATEKVLGEMGSKNIQELQQDVARSERAGNAFKERNKVLAMVQGGLSGFTGLIGAAADLPLSILLSLKTIYEVGHAYGFELDNEEDRQAIYQVFADADLGLIAEKQTIFIGLRTLKGIFATGDYTPLQHFLNSHHSVEQFQAFLTNAEGEYKWAGFGVLKRIGLLQYALPVVGAVVGAVYNLRLIEEVNQHAHQIFAHARQYLLNHQDQDMSVLDAYQRQIQLEQQSAQLPLNEVNLRLDQKIDLASTEQQQALQHIDQHEVITQVDMCPKEPKNSTDSVTEQGRDDAIEQGIKALAEQNIVVNEPVETAQNHQPQAETTSKTPRKRVPRKASATQASLDKEPVTQSPSNTTKTRKVAVKKTQIASSAAQHAKNTDNEH